MARKKTKKQKKQVSRRREETLERMQETKIPALNQEGYRIDVEELEKLDKKSKKQVKSNVPVAELYEYDPKLLVGDIVKTLVLSMVFFGVEIGLYYYLR